jgi:WD40 repeat protein
MGQALIPLSGSNDDEVDPLVLKPTISMEGPKNITSCCPTNNKNEFLVGTATGEIFLFDLETKKETKKWKQNERLTNIEYIKEENAFFTSYFKIENEDIKFQGALKGSNTQFLEMAASKNLKGKQPGEGVLRWNFESTKPELEIPGRFPSILCHQEKLLVQTKPGMIGEYTTGKFKKFVDGKLPKYFHLSSFGKNLIGVVAGTADLYVWDDKKKIKHLFDGEGSEEIITCVSGIEENVIAFSIEAILYFCEYSTSKLRSFSAHGANISSITNFHNEMLITTDISGSIKFWDVKSIYQIFVPKKSKTQFQLLKEQKNSRNTSPRE